jgi:DNA uptake protein ComE-like DNA-binding protein
MKKLAIALAAVVVWTASSAFATSENNASGIPVQIAQAQSNQIDINRASAEELMTLKGIGEARAKAIIKGRPYKRKDELAQKGIVPQSVYDGIKDQIVAKQ